MSLKVAVLSTGFLLYLSQVSMAQTTLKVIGHYSMAGDERLWKGVKADEIPNVLQSDIRISNPKLAYAGNFPKTFYQDENYFVCFKNCGEPDSKSGKDYLEQQNVYYWLGEFYKMAKERFDLVPFDRIRVMTNRTISDPGSSKKMRNNAFFNPADGTLSFLPARANPLAALLTGKLNRSGFDPSVVAHEAGHSLFHTLFPNAINPEIHGFNEGFADYLANILLKNSKVGMVMLRGKALRDSESMVDSSNKTKIYEPGLEVHDMGERFATALWLGRQKVQNVDEYDTLVIGAIKDIARNPFATGHGFKRAFLNRTKHIYDRLTSDTLIALWNLFVPGEDKVFVDTTFLKKSALPKKSWGIQVSTTFPESVARDLGLKNENKRFVYAKSHVTTDGNVAHLVAHRDDSLIRPYWILVDPERKNALGAWRLDGSNVTSEANDEMKEVSDLTAQLLTIEDMIKEFFEKAKMFSELAEGRGQLKIAYKIKEKKTAVRSIEFNGAIIQAKVHRYELKRRIIAMALGIPNMKAVSFITAPSISINPTWPKLEGVSIIGLKLELEDGTVTESILEPLIQ